MQLNYEFDRQLELERADAREEGYEEGREAGIQKGIEEGRKEGRKEGREEGREEGRKEGREIGRKETLNMVNQLNQILLAEGRFEDLKRSLENEEYQDELLKEHGLKS